MTSFRVRVSTDWAPASIVLDVPEIATELHFGALLTGAGAGWPWPLPDEPQGLDFAVAP